MTEEKKKKILAPPPGRAPSPARPFFPASSLLRRDGEPERDDPQGGAPAHPGPDFSLGSVMIHFPEPQESEDQPAGEPSAEDAPSVPPPRVPRNALHGPQLSVSNRSLPRRTASPPSPPVPTLRNPFEGDPQPRRGTLGDVPRALLGTKWGKKITDQLQERGIEALQRLPLGGQIGLGAAGAAIAGGIVGYLAKQDPEKLDGLEIEVPVTPSLSVGAGLQVESATPPSDSSAGPVNSMLKDAKEGVPAAQKNLGDPLGSSFLFRLTWKFGKRRKRKKK
jgi:hypothetical protein